MHNSYRVCLCVKSQAATTEKLCSFYDKNAEKFHNLIMNFYSIAIAT